MVLLCHCCATDASPPPLHTHTALSSCLYPIPTWLHTQDLIVTPSLPDNPLIHTPGGSPAEGFWDVALCLLQSPVTGVVASCHRGVPCVGTPSGQGPVAVQDCLAAQDAVVCCAACTTGMIVMARLWAVVDCSKQPSTMQSSWSDRVICVLWCRGEWVGHHRRVCGGFDMRDV